MQFCSLVSVPLQNAEQDLARIGRNLKSCRIVNDMKPSQIKIASKRSLSLYAGKIC